MLNTVKTFNGHDLRTGYRTGGANFNSLPSANPVFVSQALADPVDSGAWTVDVRSVSLAITITNYATRYALEDQLKQWFKRGTLGNLVVTAVSDGLDYYLPCRVTDLVQDPTYPQHWMAVMQTGYSAWHAVVVDTDTWNVSGTGGTHSITVAGTDETCLSLLLQSTSAPSIRFYYQQLVQVPNVVGIAYEHKYVCFTLNTAALVTAGKMRADCYDLRIFCDGVEIKRWISGANTTTTKGWFYINHIAGQNLTLATEVPATGIVSYLQFNVDHTHQVALAAMPKGGGIVWHDTEWIAYSYVDPINCRLTVSESGTQGTTRQLHSVGNVFGFIQNVITMVYGQSTAASPSAGDSAYDVDKPMLSLASSDNTKDVRDANTLFYDMTRPIYAGNWRLGIYKNGNISKVYTVKGDAATGDPALGTKAAAYLSGSTYKADIVKLGWRFIYPGGIKKVTVTGRKWRNSVSWPLFAGLRRGINLQLGTTFDVFNEAMPSATNTFEAITGCTALAIDPLTTVLRFEFDGSSDAAVESYALLEGLTTTLEYADAYISSVTLLGERANHQIDLTLTNAQNGDAFNIIMPQQHLKIFAIDGEEFTADYDGANAHNAVVLNDPSRAIWMRLPVGTYNLELVSADCGGLTLSLRWYRRRL